jgi:hypothetical protein
MPIIIYFGTVTLDVTSGPIGGGTTINATDTGNGFIGVCSATINGIAVTNVVVSDDQHMQFKTPPGLLFGVAYPVVFTNEDGEQVNSANNFMYLPIGNNVILPISAGDGTHYTIVNNKGSMVGVIGDYSGTLNYINNVQIIELYDQDSITVVATSANNWKII